MKTYKHYQNLQILAFCIAAIFSLCGCQDAIDLERRGYALATAFDVSGEKPEICVSIADLSSNFDEKEVKSKQKSAVGNTIADSLSDIDLLSDKKLYLGHNKVFILSEAFCKNLQVMEDFTNFSLYDSEIPKNAEILICENSAKEILNKNHENVGLFLEDYRKNNEDDILGSFRVSMGEFNKKRANGENLLIPKIILKTPETAEKTESNPSIEFDGAAVLKNGSFASYMEKSELRGFLWLTGQGASQISISGNNPQKIPAEIKIIAQRINFYESNGMLIIAPEISVSAKASYGEQKLSNLSQGAGKAVLSEILSAFEFSQKIGADIYGFRSKIRAKNYALYEKYGNSLEQWKRSYKNAIFSPSVKVIVK